MSEQLREITHYRRILSIGGAIYLLWWFAVRWIEPGAYNPISIRLIVTFVVWSVWIATYFSLFVKARLRFFFSAAMWLITAQYFHMFYVNSEGPLWFNWVVGAYITVTAINFTMLSSVALLAYTGYVTVLSAGLVFLVPQLAHNIFLPGLLTILILSNIGLQSRLKLLRSLAVSRERFQLLFNSAFEGVLVHDGGQIVEVNQACAQMLGYRPNELTGLSIENIIHPSQLPSILQRIKQGDMHIYEPTLIKKDGSPLELELRGRNLLYDGRALRLVTMMDLAERRKAEQERVRALTIAENLRARDEFISIASHELKTPISSLKLQAQMVERDLKSGRLQVNLPEKLESAIALFNRQIERLTELVESMLDASLIATGGLPTNRDEMDFAAIIREVATVIQMHTRLPISVHGPEKLIIFADRSAIQQVVENLLTNAVKYGDQKPISVRFGPFEGMASFAAEDHGIGIASENTGRIFDRFERAVSSHKISGLGLGLYISQKIVEAHGGSIRVESTPGHGSIFTVLLPMLA